MESWKAVGLTALRTVLDEQALAVAQNREASSKRRKVCTAPCRAVLALAGGDSRARRVLTRVLAAQDLGQSTRAFKKGSDQEKVAGLNAILKVYQEEIDNLTKRAKYCESAFTGLYASLREAPDPVPHLQDAVALEPETQHLRAQNDELQDELLRLRLDLKETAGQKSEAKSQGAIVQELREKIEALKEELEESYNDNLYLEQQQQMQKELDERSAQLEASTVLVEDLRRQLAIAGETASQARQAHDASQAHLLEKGA
jgi:homeobox protein cut-like